MIEHLLPHSDLPLDGVRLNRGHPLARRFVAAYLPGITSDNLGSGDRGSILTNNSARAIIPSGPALRLSGSGVSATFARSFGPTPSYPLTMVVVCRQSNNTTGTIAAIAASSAISGSYFYVGGGSSTILTFAARNAFGTALALNVTVPADANGNQAIGQDLVIVAQSLSASDHRLCVNGSAIVTATTNIGSMSAWDRLFLGQTSGITGLDVAAVLFAHGGTALTDAQMRQLSRHPREVWALFEPVRIWVPVSSGGGSSLDLGGNALLTGAVAASGDLQIVPAPILDLSGTAALAGSLTPSGNLQYTVPVDLTGTASLSGTFTATGDLQYSTAVFLDLAAQPVTLAATFTAAGDLDPYPELDLSGARSASLAGAVIISGALQYGTPFDVSAGAGSPLNAVLGASGELQFSVAPPPPPVQYAVGGGGGGRGLRELTERIGKDAEELLSIAKGTSRERTPRPLAPAPATTRVARSEGPDRRNDHAAAKLAVPSAQNAVLSELHSLRSAVERLEALLLADREAAARKREQDAEEAAVIKLLTG